MRLSHVVSISFGFILLAFGVAAAEPYDLEAERTNYFLKCLHALEEKPLEPRAQDRSAEIYRAIYLPSLYPQVSMRLDVWPPGGGRLTLRRIPPYCSDRAPPIEEKIYAISEAEVALVRDAFARANFWNLATTEAGEDGERVTCTDGAGFHFEAVRNGAHRRVSRSCIWSDNLDRILVVFHQLARIKDPYRTDTAD
jgi:hypothetical protein